MRLLPRLRYVLEVCRPAAPVVLSILAILCRVAQHSTAAAHEIVRCPRLLDTVVSQFLPLSWKPVTAEVTTADLYGTPVCGALKLLRSICSAGKHMATSLVSGRMTCGQALLFLLVREGLERSLFSEKLLSSPSRTRSKRRAWSQVCGRTTWTSLRAGGLGRGSRLVPVHVCTLVSRGEFNKRLQVDFTSCTIQLKHHLSDAKFRFP